MAGVSHSFPVPKHNIGMPQPFLSRLLSVFTIFPGEAVNPQTASTVLRVPQIPQPSLSSVLSILSNPILSGEVQPPRRHRSAECHHTAWQDIRGLGAPIIPEPTLRAVPGPREQRVLPVGSIRPLRPWGHPRGPAQSSRVLRPTRRVLEHCGRPGPVGYEAQGGQGAGRVGGIAGTAPRDSPAAAASPRPGQQLSLGCCSQSNTPSPGRAGSTRQHPAEPSSTQ